MSDVQEAIKQAIQTEKNAMNFYELGAKQMKDQDAKKMFEQLAKEEREHASHFYKAYTGSDLGSFDDFMAAPPQNESVWISSIQKVIGPDFKCFECACGAIFCGQEHNWHTHHSVILTKHGGKFESGASRKPHVHDYQMRSNFSDALE